MYIVIINFYISYLSLTLFSVSSSFFLFSSSCVELLFTNVFLYTWKVCENESGSERKEREREYFSERPLPCVCVYVYMSVYTHINITAIFGVYFNLLYIPRLYYFVYCLSLYLFRLDACNLVLLYKKQKVYIWYKIL